MDLYIFRDLARTCIGFHKPLSFALPIALFRCLALVVLLFALGKTNFKLDSMLVVMEVQRN